MKRNIQLLSLAIFLLITSLYKAQCTANFNYTVLPSNNVNFVSTSTFTNAGTNYTWAFGDGVIAIGPTASHQYSASGVYSASLSIINTGPSCTSSTTQTISVAVTSTCNITPNFSYTINVGGVINFSNTSTGTTSLTSYSWNFDDGTAVYQTATTTHSYMSNGNYSVTLYVTDSLNYCYNSITIPILINNLPCNVNPFFTYYFGPNATISFFGNSSPYSPSNTFGWNFGDGGTATIQNPVHSYTASGIYSVSLVTTDITGTCNATYSNTVSIIACSLTANFSYTLGNNGLVTFSNTSSSISSSTITNINWNFDDGNHGYGSQITNNYINNGVYNVHLTITDTSSVSGWCNDTITIPISVTNVTCGIGVSANAYGCNSYIVGPYINNTGCFYANITYTGTTNYTWYFGDGAQSNLLNCVHTYSLNGTYTSTFVVWDSLSPICSKTVVLSPLSITGATCNLNANFNYTNGAVGLVNFNDLSTGTSSLTNYYWNFGDGNSAFGSAIIATNNTYLSNGLYNVSLFIVDSLTPCANYTVIPVNVTNSSNTGCNANSIFSLYKDYSQNYSWYAYPNYQSTAVSAIWSWGDGTTSTGFYPVHTYSAAGYYNICLTVSLSCGSQSTTCNNTNIYRTTANVTANMLSVNVINSMAVGIKTNNTNLENIKLYPNPNKGIFNISLDHKNEAYQLDIYNSLGELVYQSMVINELLEINLEASPIGLYYVKLKGKEGNKTFKFIKE